MMGRTLRTGIRWFGDSTMPPVPMTLPVEKRSRPESTAAAVVSMTWSRLTLCVAMRSGSACTVMSWRRSFQMATLATPGTWSSRARMFQ